MRYSMLLEKREETEAFDIILLHFKIAPGMKQSSIFNRFCLRDMFRQF